MSKLFLFVGISVIIGFSACNDPVDNSCFDAALKESMADSVCIATCEGICACNQVTYCNECEAMKEGYRVAVGDTLPCSPK